MQDAARASNAFASLDMAPLLNILDRDPARSVKPMAKKRSAKQKKAAKAKKMKPVKKVRLFAAKGRGKGDAAAKGSGKKKRNCIHSKAYYKARRAALIAGKSAEDAKVAARAAAKAAVAHL